MDENYVLGVTSIPYLGFKVIMSKKDNTKMCYGALCQKRKWVYCKHLYYVFKFIRKVDFDNDKFIHAPTYAYNEVMRFLELVRVVAPE